MRLDGSERVTAEIVNGLSELIAKPKNGELSGKVGTQREAQRECEEDSGHRVNLEPVIYRERERDRDVNLEEKSAREELFFV